MLEKTFGVLPTNPKERVYHRTGAYGVIFNDRNEVAAMQMPMGYFLPGGGLEGEESHRSCIQRECLEEAGIEVLPGPFVCKSDMYIWSDEYNLHLHGIGYFYLTRFLRAVGGAVEKDHELCWLPVAECIESLFQDHQAWALEQAAIVHLRDKNGDHPDESMLLHAFEHRVQTCRRGPYAN